MTDINSCIDVNGRVSVLSDMCEVYGGKHIWCKRPVKEMAV